MLEKCNSLLTTGAAVVPARGLGGLGLERFRDLAINQNCHERVGGKAREHGGLDGGALVEIRPEQK